MTTLFKSEFLKDICCQICPLSDIIFTVHHYSLFWSMHGTEVSVASLWSTRVG